MKLYYERKIARAPSPSLLPSSDAALTLAIIIISIANCCSIIATIALVIHYFPCNHWNYEIRWLYAIVLCDIPAVVVVGLSAGGRPARAWVLLVLSSVMLFAVIAVVDRCNLLVNYEVWVSRGMPDPPGI